MGATGYIIKGHNGGRGGEARKEVVVSAADGTIDVEKVETFDKVDFRIKTTYDGYETISVGSLASGGYFKAAHIKFNEENRRYRLVCILNGGSYTPVAKDFAIYYIKFGWRTGGVNADHWYIEEYSRQGNGAYVSLEQIALNEYNVLIHTPTGYAYANIGILKEDKETGVTIDHFNNNTTRYTPTGTIIETETPAWKNGAPAISSLISSIENPVVGQLGYYNGDRYLYFFNGTNWINVYALTDNYVRVFNEEDIDRAIADTSVSLIKVVGQIEMTHPITINRDGLYLEGESIKTSKLRFQKTYDGIILNKPKCKLSNLTIGNARVGIIVNSNTCLIENCSIGQCYLGVAFRSAFISKIINSYIEQNYVGAYATGENYETQIDKCRIDNNLGGIGIVSSGSNTPIISNNTIEGNRVESGDKFGAGLVLGGFLGATTIKDNFFEKNGETADSVDVFMWDESINTYTEYNNVLSKINAIIATYIPDDLIISGRPKVRDCMIGSVSISNNRFSLTPNSTIISAIKATIKIADNYYFGAKKDVFPTGLKPILYYSANSNVQSILKVYRNVYIQSDATKIVDTSDERGAGIFISGNTDNVFIEDDNYFNNPIPKDFVASNLEIMGLSNTKYSSGTNNYEYYTFKSFINSVIRYHKSVSSDYRYIMYGDTELTDANFDFSDKVLFVYGFGKLKGRTYDNQYRDYDLNGWTLIDLTLYQNGGRLVAWPNVSLICGVLASKDLKYNSISYPVTTESMPNNQINLDKRNVGITSLAPTGVDAGFQYFDTDLGKPIYWTGSKWVDANGNDLQ